MKLSTISIRLLFVGLVFAALAGCSSKTYLMPTPNAYTHPEWNPFAGVPPELQTDSVNVLYVTDRAPTKQAPDQWAYGDKRSLSAAFGEAKVQIGRNETWADLVAASRMSKRDHKLELTNPVTNELGRFGRTPPEFVVSDASMAQVKPTTRPESEVQKQFLDELKKRLAATPRKEVYMFIHGFNDSFDDSIYTMAELWHFLGREGVPIAYSWPAGEGLVRAYIYTIFSGEFTIYHLKQTLKLIASCPEVEKVHIIGHSRGTDVATTAIRELYLETRSTPGETEKLKLGTVVMAAADLDLDVVLEMDATERIGRAVEGTAIYLCNKDKALALSNWLSLGQMRLGDLDPKVFTPEDIKVLHESRRLQMIDARVGNLGPFNHSYFHHNPAVSSDLMLYLRFNLLPGAEHGRPLETSKAGLWLIEDGYPGKDWTIPAAVAGE